MNNPLARTDELTIEELGQGLLVYDFRTDRAHSVSPVATRIWRACDGQTPDVALAVQLALEPDQVARALDELDACDLLQGPVGDTSGLSRRELSVRVVKGAAAVAAAPMIVSIVAPTPAAALTPGCEAVGGCLDDCGNTTHGCQGTACTCCQLSKINCPQGGGGIQRTSNVKYCAPGTAANCPPMNNTTFCTTPCPAARQSSPEDSKTGQPSTPSGGEPTLPGDEPPPVLEPPPTAEPPPPSTTPAPTTPEAPATSDPATTPDAP